MLPTVIVTVEISAPPNSVCQSSAAVMELGGLSLLGRVVHLDTCTLMPAAEQRGLAERVWQRGDELCR